MTRRAFPLGGLLVGTLTLTVPLATLAPTDAVAARPESVAPSKSIGVQNSPDVQTTATASRPCVITDLADLGGGDFAVPVGSFSVPAG